MKRALCSIICFSLLLIMLIAIGILWIWGYRTYPDWLAIVSGIVAFLLVIVGSLALGSAIDSQTTEAHQ